MAEHDVLAKHRVKSIFIVKITKMHYKMYMHMKIIVQEKVTLVQGSTDTRYVHVLMKSVKSFTWKIFSHGIHQLDVSQDTPENADRCNKMHRMKPVC